VARAPVVLIVCQHEWSSRSIGAVLGPRGYAVIRAYNGEQGIERSATSDPDAVFIDPDLPDMEAAELCGRLLEEEAVSRAAALIVLSASPVSRVDRLRVLEAGAWDVLTYPLDAEELTLRMDRFIRGKLEADRLREEAMIDAATGLYTREGINQRIREVGAAAQRFGRPLACIVFTSEPEQEGEDGRPDAEAVAFAEMLRRMTRKSDVLARLGPHEFAVLAPDTPPQGAKTLVDRLRQSGGKAAQHVAFQAGVFAVENLREAGLEPLEMFDRASAASRAYNTN
jgi:two-component system, cell cycle response regulator